MSSFKNNTNASSSKMTSGSSSAADISTMVPSKKSSGGSSLKKFTVFKELPPELRIAIWEMAIADACPEEPTLCVYSLLPHQAGYRGNKSGKVISWDMPATLHTCQESRYETQIAKHIKWVINQHTGTYTNPHRLYCPKFDILYIPFGLFVRSLDSSTLPTFLCRNPSGPSSNEQSWCQDCYERGWMRCRDCFHRGLKLINNLLQEHAWSPSFVEDVQRLSTNGVAAFGARRIEPTGGDFGLMVQEVEGKQLLRTAYLRSDSRLLEDMAKMKITITGEGTDWSFIMPQGPEFTVFPKGQWPN
ncbi:hypothetical protein Hte_011863 [Hypoxylon texense]